MPRWATPRSPERDTFGHGIIAVAKKLGIPFMPWQEQVALVGGELIWDDETQQMVPAYREVIVTVPRQQGKTLLALCWEIQRAIGWGEPQRIVYSAQSGSDARKKLIEDQMPLLERRRSKLGILTPLKGMGNEAVPFANGSRIVLLASTEDSGHGKTVDLAVKDEFFADHDNRRDQALGPAMLTRPAAQILTLSTAGTEQSFPLNAAIDRGRLAVDLDERTGVAYFEWSAGDDEDPDDPATWWRCMPALGHGRVTERVVALERQRQKDSEFVRAYLNRKTKADERVIPPGAWSDACSPTASPDGRPTFALDVNPDRSAAAIVAASPGVAEVVDIRAGTGWLVERAIELSARWDGPGWVVDSTGPAASLVPDLTRAGLRVHAATPRELVAACGQFYDGVMQGSVALRQHAKLDEAAAAATKRTIGDSWAWARKNAMADISPLVAATLALWGASSTAGKAMEPFLVVT